MTRDISSISLSERNTILWCRFYRTCKHAITAGDVVTHMFPTVAIDEERSELLLVVVGVTLMYSAAILSVISFHHLGLKFLLI